MHHNQLSETEPDEAKECPPRQEGACVWRLEGPEALREGLRQGARKKNGANGAARAERLEANSTEATRMGMLAMCDDLQILKDCNMQDVHGKLGPSQRQIPGNGWQVPGSSPILGVDASDECS